MVSPLPPSARSGAGEAGQASVELVAFLPLMVVLGFALFSVVSAASARELASQAAEAGAVALLQDRDPRAAARAALPDDGAGAEIEVAQRRVEVTVRPRGPIARLNAALEARAAAAAGPEPAP